MEDFLKICAVAVADFAPWTCGRCESINHACDACEVCDEPRWGRNIDIEDEPAFDVEDERFEYIQIGLYDF